MSGKPSPSESDIFLVAGMTVAANLVKRKYKSVTIDKEFEALYSRNMPSPPDPE